MYPLWRNRFQEFARILLRARSGGARVMAEVVEALEIHTDKSLRSQEESLRALGEETTEFLGYIRKNMLPRPKGPRQKLRREAETTEPLGN